MYCSVANAGHGYCMQARVIPACHAYACAVLQAAFPPVCICLVVMHTLTSCEGKHDAVYLTKHMESAETLAHVVYE